MKTIKFTFITAIFLGVSICANAQKNYTVATTSTFSVLGTSSLHDWEMKSDAGTGTADITVAEGKITEIGSMTIVLSAESIKSEKKSMDKVAYETMNTKSHKNVKYVLKSAEKANESTWNLTGTYTIAGTSKEYKTQVKSSVANGVVTLHGTQKITFTDFGMTPPKALLGTIKAGNELTINFNVIFK